MGLEGNRSGRPVSGPIASPTRRKTSSSVKRGTNRELSRGHHCRLGNQNQLTKCGVTGALALILHATHLAPHLNSLDCESLPFSYLPTKAGPPKIRYFRDSEITFTSQDLSAAKLVVFEYGATTN